MTTSAAAEPRSTRGMILFYCGALIALLNLAAPSNGLLGVPIIYLLKNKLHLQAQGVAVFVLLAGAPVYVSFVLGYLRDRWSPLGLGDRGHLIVFGGATAALFAASALVPPTLPFLAAGLVAISFTILMTFAAQNGLATVLARRHGMTGQVSAAWNIASTAPLVVGLVVGGALSDALEPGSAGAMQRAIFLMGAVLMAATALFGLWKPAAVFSGLETTRAPPRHPLADLGRLLGHRPVWPALLIWILWWFSPGGVTPLQYFLSDVLKGNDALFGLFNAISDAALLPTYMLFGLLAPRFSLRTLLLWATLIGAWTYIPLLFVHSPAAVMWAAIPNGLLGGLAGAAFLDLLMRACPEGLEGTMMMLGVSLMSLSQNLGNVWGTELYEHAGGFPACVAASTATNLAILLVLPFVPRSVAAAPDLHARVVE